jgi:hypothetical protein
MKRKLAVCLIVSGGVFWAHAQGTVDFANHGIDWNGNSYASPVYEIGGVTPCGPNYDAALVYGGLGELGDPTKLIPGSTTALSGNGLFSGPTLTLPFPTLARIPLTVVVWNSAWGNNWTTVYNNFPGVDWGFASLSVVLGGNGRPPGNLETMPSFSMLGPIPEPPTMSLFGAGAGIAYLWTKRRRVV